jgi:hypothetical protein
MLLKKIKESRTSQSFPKEPHSAVPKRAYIMMGELMYQSHYAYTECGLGSRIIMLPDRENLIFLMEVQMGLTGLAYGLFR